MPYAFIICNNMEEAKLNESPYGNEDYEISADDIKALEDGKTITAMIAGEYGVFIKMKSRRECDEI